MAKKKSIKTFDEIIKQLKKSNTCIIVTDKNIDYVGDFSEIVMLYDKLTLGLVNINPSVETYSSWRDYFNQLADLFEDHIEKLNKKNEEGVKDEL